MSWRRIAFSFAMLITIGIAGCEKQDEPAKSPTPNPPTPDLTPKAATPGIAKADGPLVTTTPKVAAPTTTKSPEPVPGDNQHAKAAQELLAKSTQYIKENKLDLARQSLDKVESMKDSLPKTVQEQLVTARTALESAQKLKELPLPSLPNLDNK